MTMIMAKMKTTMMRISFANQAEQRGRLTDLLRLVLRGNVAAPGELMQKEQMLKAARSRLTYKKKNMLQHMLILKCQQRRCHHPRCSHHRRISRTRTCC
jgi:hypothetical protein